MRILYLDIDSLRPDHLGCYGYHRQTSPNIDQLAANGVCFTNCYASDVPCLPSRSALFSGRAGIHTGVINHGGVASQPFIEGAGRNFRDTLYDTCWMTQLRNQGMRTVTISPFGERHAAWHWYAGFSEIHNPRGNGLERGDQVWPTVQRWLNHNADEDNWFLHINLWDPHSPYRTPRDFQADYSDEPLPAWYNESIRQEHWNDCGPHSAQEVTGFGYEAYSQKLLEQYPDHPGQIDSMDKARMMFDGYDRGVRYADHYVGKMIDALKDNGLYDDTIIIISADHGENLGELNIYGDHHTADQITGNIPLIVHWPGVTDQRAGEKDHTLLNHFDFAATVIQMLGGQTPRNWDGIGFAEAFKQGKPSEHREYVIIGQGAWSCQRGIRFDHNGDRYICIRSYHDGYHNFPDLMLFNLTNDPHEQHNLAELQPNIANKAIRLLDQWTGDMMRTASHGQDPMWTVIHEGGAFHTRGNLAQYLQRLEDTNRSHCAKSLKAKHSKDL
ncbi:sulfatase [Poriferisphaera sp. WC338]|uniref:sulfatase n=1 Tax=Poriferisphaera sp. WC338 TaxID=3425129 RepID=UPI003D814D15